jgi:NADP-dependent 3-hydroxy acid dehydrogenase YdfG
MNSMPAVLLTGAAHGIGHATAVALAQKGAALALIDRDASALMDLGETLKKQGATIAYASADVRDRAALVAAVADFTKIVGPIDVLVACAAIGTLTLVPELDTPGLRETLEVNLVGVAHCIEAVLPGMIERKRGHIIGVASMAGYRGFPWMISYSASRARGHEEAAKLCLPVGHEDRSDDPQAHAGRALRPPDAPGRP